MSPGQVGEALMRLVLVDPRARAAWSWLPAAAPRGSWFVGPLGERVQVLDDGRVDPAPDCLPHLRGRAADPCAGPA